MLELEAFANFFGGTCHSFIEIVPICHEQPNYLGEKKLAKLFEGIRKF